MTVAELIAQLQQLNPKAEVVQSECVGTYSPTSFVEVGLYDANSTTTGDFWVPVAEDDDDQPWTPEPGVDVHAVCLWAASWPRGENDETGA